MPREVMVLTGNDFDADKMLCHFKDFIMREYDEDKIWALYNKAKESNESYDNLFKALFGDEFKPGSIPSFRSFRNNILNQEDYIRDNNLRFDKPHVISIQYDYGSDPENQSREARNNAEIDLMFANITSKKGTMRFLIPGGFEPISRMAYATKILKSRDPKVQEKLNNIMTTGGFTTRKELRDYMLATPSENLRKFLAQHAAKESALSLHSRYASAREIMAGRDTISRYALYNSGLAMLQNSGIGIQAYFKEVHGQDGTAIRDANGEKIYEELMPVIFGYTLDRLDEIMDKEGRLKSGVLAQLISAAVDNRNKPILSLLNQNEATIGLTLAFIASGLPRESVFTLINQPIVEKLAVMKAKNPFADISTLINSLIDDIQLKLSSKYTPAERLSKFPQGFPTAITRMQNRSEADFIEHLGEDPDKTDEEFIKDQLAVLYMLRHMAGVSEDLNTLIMCLRPENAKNGCGPLIASVVSNRKRIEDMRDRIENGECKITFEYPLLITYTPDIDDPGSAIDQAYALNDVLPMTSMMNSMQLYGSTRLLSPYMVMATENWMGALAQTLDMYDIKRPKDALAQQAFNEMMTFKLLKDPALVSDDMPAQRQDLVVELPKRLMALKGRLTDVRKLLDNPKTAGSVTANERALAENKFLMKLFSVIPKDADKIPRIQLRLGGVLTQKITQQLRDGWDELMYMKGSVTVKDSDQKSYELDINKFAIELFKYNMYTDGFGFGQYTISQMAPPSVQLYCPGWISALKKLSDPAYGDFTPEEFERFRVQYIMNHWYDRRLVHRVEDDVWKKVFKEEKDGKVLLVPHYAKSKEDIDAGDRDIEPITLYGTSNFLAHRDANGKVTLYRVVGVDTKSGEILLEAYPKVGSYDSFSQVGVQYEPLNPDPKSIIPVHTGVDSSWGNFSWTQKDELNVFNLNNIDAENPSDNEGKPMTEEQRNAYLRSKALGRYLPQSSNVASEASSAAPRSAIDDLQNLLNSRLGIRVVQPESPENTSAQTEAAIQANEAPQTESTTPEEGTPQQNPMAKALQDMLNSKLGGRSFMLVRHSIDENGRPVVQTEEHRGTPAVINEARDMKVNYEVNKVLRKILADVGVGVGVLYDFEARLGAAGVTDFSQANVVAEGLLELIRIAEGEEGEAALPEEFSHLAIAMLGPNDSLVNRLRDTMSMDVIRDILGEFFDEYNTLYNGNLRRLQFEAMGQLVARHLINGEPIQPKPYRNLLQRIIDKIKDILRRIGIRNLQYELAKANEAASYIAEGFLNGNLADLLRKENITESDKYYGFNKISKAIEDNGDALNKILQRDVKRYHMLKERTKRSKQSTRSSYLDTATSFIEEIEKAKTAVDKTKQNLAINTYLKSAITFIGKCNDGINSAISSGMDANRVCGRLRIDRDMIYSFQDTLKDLRTFSRQNPGVLTTETSGLLNSCQTLLTAFYEHYHEVAMTYFTEFVKTYMGEEMTIGIGKHKGEKITADNVVLGADKDISFINRWLDSMADQPDMLNKIFDIAVKEYKSKVRLHDIEVRQKIDVAFSRFLKETGSRDQSFMFERKDGKRTGDYISEKECISRYGTNSAQYRFYKAMMDIKKECDTWFPTGVTSELNTIKIHKDLLDRMKSSASVTDALNNVLRAMQDKLFVRSSDEEYQAARAIVDFEGNKFDLVPIYYMHLGQGEREEDMSEDVASTMLAYSHMAMNYKELSGIINILENARSMAQERRITIRRGGKPEQESINAAGYLVPRTHTKAQKETMIGQMLDDFFSMQVYGHMRADQGTFGNTNISQQKAADVINEATTFSQMALNIPQRFSNVNTGVVQIAEEALANEEFSPKTLAKANIWYSERLPEFWSKVGMDTNDSELALLDEMFDITQENQRRFKDREYRKNAVEKNADKGLLTLGLTAGEHYLSMTTGTSIMLEYEMRDDKGNKTDLLHSLERVYLDPVNKTGAKMAIKKGYTKPDGTEFNADDIFKMTNKIAAVNFRLQGIYNTQDKNMLLQYNYGVLIMMFRKWMMPNIRRRYGESNYNFMTEKWGEGFYRTFFNMFIPRTMEELRHLRTTVTTNWQNMTPTEKANVRRAWTEIGTWIGIQLSLMLLGRVHVDDDKENKDFDDWLFEMTYYQLLRLKTEIGAQLPWPPSMIREGKKILAEPFAGLKTLENTVALINLFDPRSYTTRMQSGPYKGRTKAHTYLMKAPYINIGRTIGRAFDQSDLIEYYKQ